MGMTSACEARGLLFLIAISACESPTQTLCESGGYSGGAPDARGFCAEVGRGVLAFNVSCYGGEEAEWSVAVDRVLHPF